MKSRAVALLYYAVATTIAVARYRDLMSPDAIAYLRNARYLAEGRFAQSVSGVWSPLVSWCVAPLVALGIDPLHALYAILALWGAAVVWFTGRLLERTGALSAGWSAVALLLVADATVKWGATSWPDVILAACLLAAAGELSRPDLAVSRLPAIRCGVWGGLAYLGKAYGLPFFLVLVPISLLALHAGRTDRRKILAAWGIATATAVAVAAPWILAVSWKFQRPTIGLAGSLNHAIVGPDDPSRDELWKPVEGRVTVWEIPETRDYRYWSPFDGRESFLHQARFTWRTAKQIRDAVLRFDYLGLSVGLVVLAPFLAWSMGRSQETRRAAWFAAVAAAFCAPLALVNFEYRYVEPFLRPLCVVGGFHAAGLLEGRARRAALVVVALSFSATVNLPFRPYTYPNPDGTPFDDTVVDTTIHRRIAKVLKERGLHGPIASTRYWGGMFLGYFLDEPFVGQPAGATAEICARELDDVGAQVLLMDPEWRFAPELAADSRWEDRGTVDVGDGRAMLVLARRQSSSRLRFFIDTGPTPT